MRSRRFPKHAALVAALASLALLEGADAGAAAAPARALAGLTRGQISFDGLDLSEDEPKKSGKKDKGKKGKAGKKDARKDRPAEDGAAGTGEGGGLDFSGVGQPASGTSGADTAGGLDLTKPDAGKPAEPPKKEKPAPVMTFDAVDVSGTSAERQRLDLAKKLFDEGGYEGAALAFQEILRDPKMAELHDDAQYMLSKALYKMGMYHSALNGFKVILAKGPNGKYFKVSLEWLFFIANKTVNEQVVLEELAKYANYEFPERFRAQFRYLLARYHFARGKALDEAGQPEESKKSFEEAKRLTLMVPKGDRFYGKVKYLEGTVAFKEGAFASALEAFKEVVRSNNPRTNPDADPKLRSLAFMQLARTHYGHKQNRYAIYYYERIPPGSEQWLEALFESSWAHFRIGQYERALGNLITLSSPFFRDEYFPEALILKAVIYYENCRYKEARAILDEFENTYLPVHNELEKLVAQNADAQTFFDIFAEIQRRNREDGAKGSTLLLERILKLALSDKDLKAVNESILELEKELDSIVEKPDSFKYSELAKSLDEGLKAERAELLKKAGILAKAKLEFELGQLKDLLGQALRIKFETSDKEKQFLQSQLQEGGATEIVKSYTYRTAVNDERQYWPYEGEYWRDELGTYEYTLTKGCKEK